jgi:peptide/nickel transport system permease protein
LSVVATPAPAISHTVTTQPIQVRAARHEFWRRFRRNRLAVAGTLLVLLELVLLAVGPLIAPYDPIAQDSAGRLQGPTTAHLMGTDDLGRDVFSRILHGTRYSIVSGLVVLVIGLVVGVPLGAVAAYARKLDAPIMRVNDVLLAFPALLLALSLVAMLGPSLPSVLLGVGISSVPPTVLLARGLVLSVQQNDYVTAARALGCRDRQILVWHILPNCVSPLLIAASFRIALGILAVSTLSFLGLGAQPPIPEWGAMLSNGRDFLYRAPHVAAFPGLALAVTVLAFNLLGDGLRDMLDPRYTEQH